MQAVILAAGRGTRLGSITATRTKAMCPIAGKPIVERVMDTLVANGMDDFILVTSPDDDEIVDYFTRHSEIDANIKLIEQLEPLGMGHALLQAAPLIKGDFVLSSCDSLVDEKDVGRMLDYWKQRDLNGLLAILKVGPREIVRMGIIDWDGKEIKKIVEKPTLDEAPSNFGSMPLYVFSPRLLKYLPKIKPSPRSELELQDSIRSLIAEEGAVHGLILPARIDLTIPKDLLRLNLHYLTKDVPQTEIALDKVGKNTYFTNPVVIDEGVTIGADCAIGPNVYLEKGCMIEDNVQLEDCVVLRDTVVQENSKIDNQVLW